MTHIQFHLDRPHSIQYPKDEVKASQNPHSRHHGAQALSDHAQSHTDDQEEEEAQGVSCSTEDGDDEEEGEGRCAAAVFVDVAVVGKVGGHFDDEEDYRSRDVILHGSIRGQIKVSIHSAGDGLTRSPDGE